MHLGCLCVTGLACAPTILLTVGLLWPSIHPPPDMCRGREVALAVADALCYLHDTLHLSHGNLTARCARQRSSGGSATARTGVQLCKTPVAAFTATAQPRLSNNGRTLPLLCLVLNISTLPKPIRAATCCWTTAAAS